MCSRIELLRVRAVCPPFEIVLEANFEVLVAAGSSSCSVCDDFDSDSVVHKIQFVCGYSKQLIIQDA
jgi:hypothetical protein